VRYRDIKKSAELLKVHGFTQAAPSKEDLRLAAEIREAKKRRRQQLKYERQRATLPPESLPEPPSCGLKRGPKPNPFLDKCEHGLHTNLTKREKQAFEAYRKQAAPHATPSTFLRWIVCKELERSRRKDLPTMPFGVDLENLDERQSRPVGAARSAAPLAA
jgi:hypothetical protein